MSGAVWALSHVIGEVSCHGEKTVRPRCSPGTMSSNRITGRGWGDNHPLSEIPRVFSCHDAQPGALELGVAVEVFWMGSDRVPPIPTGP